MNRPGTDERADRAERRLLGWVVAISAVGTLAVAVWNPLNLVHGHFYAAGLWLLAMTALAALIWVLVWSIRRPRLRRVVAAAGAFVAVAPAVMLPILLLGDPAPQEDVVLAEQGALQLVHVSGIRPVEIVELRRTVGPLRQKTVVWEGRLPDDEPGAAAFAGLVEFEIEVRHADGTPELFRVQFDLLTLAPYPAHRVPR
ncbi:hypothetical protein WEH80_22860 [Actinomycetes bacterium KLBMP 9759]